MASDKISITGERIRELYEDHGYSQKEFADFLGISTAQLRRYEKDPDQPIRSDLLIIMAKHFPVSTDYLLGLTPVTKNNHELEHLHLTEAACEKLIRGEVSGDTLSRLIEHEKFGELIEDITDYFDNSRAESIAVQAEMTALGASMIHKHAHETQRPDIAHAAANGLAAGTADAQKIQLEDISSLLYSVLKDTKEKIEKEKVSSGAVLSRKPASAITVARIAEIVEEARSQNHLTREEQIDYSADKIVEEISAKTGLKGTAIRILKPVFRFIFKNTGKDNP